MATIEIDEESLGKDKRFARLVQALGCADKALGALVRCWLTARKYYPKSEHNGLITESKWKKYGLEDQIIEVGLAERRTDGIYVCGSKRFRGPKKVKVEPPTAMVWEAYKSAYMARWKVTPIDNSRVRAQLLQFLKRVGEKDAPEIIKFYVGHNDGFYVKSGHAIGPALRDAESLQMQWQKGMQITNTKIRAFEKMNSHRELVDRIDQEGV